MSEPAPTVVHLYRLSTATKIILAALAIGLALNVLAPFLHGPETRAQGVPMGLMNLSCEGTLPEHGGIVKLNCTGATL